MSRGVRILGITVFFIFFLACASSYKAKPLPFRAAASYANATEVAGAHMIYVPVALTTIDVSLKDTKGEE